jgi:hypothetical protein
MMYTYRQLGQMRVFINQNGLVSLEKFGASVISLIEEKLEKF